MEILKNATFLKNLAISFILVLSSSAAFGLGRLSVLKAEKEPIVIENTDLGGNNREASSSVAINQASTPSASAVATSTPSQSSQQSYVASKTGTVYYFPWCGNAKRIKPENLVSFSSREEAERAGYKAGNCPGLK